MGRPVGTISLETSPALLGLDFLLVSEELRVLLAELCVLLHLLVEFELDDLDFFVAGFLSALDLSLDLELGLESTHGVVFVIPVQVVKVIAQTNAKFLVKSKVVNRLWFAGDFERGIIVGLRT